MWDSEDMLFPDRRVVFGRLSDTVMMGLTEKLRGRIERLRD